MLSFILHVAPVGLSIPSPAGLFPYVATALLYVLQLHSYTITQFSDQVKVKVTSQLINSISNVFQKLLKYFNGITILT